MTAEAASQGLNWINASFERHQQPGLSILQWDPNQNRERVSSLEKELLC